ncbi:dystroglycan isoform X2 [Haematobia irritans]|uniref:dystroglycan isoform X2 n=1 Tax=Haematobia irritans TaxID=7368 RepID=UPI003F4F46A0
MMLPKLDLSIAPFRTRTRDTSETLAMATESMSSSRTRRWRCSSTLATTYPLVLLSLTLQLLLVLNPVVISNAERDFNFNDSQVPLLEPKDEPTLSETHTHLHQHHHHQQQLQQQQQPHQHQDPYALELSHCRYGDNELVLSLVLQNYNWHDLNESRKAKVMDKLSKFFAIPKEFIVTESASKHDLYEMQKESLKKGNNKCHTNNHRKLGRVDFIIGCHSKYFSITEPIVKQIEQQMKDGALDNITGEKFGWWVIWRKHYKTRAIRNRRQVEGSGTQYDEDGDEEDDYEYEDEEEIVNQAQPISSTSTTTTHNTYGQPAATNTNTEDDDESEMNPNKLEVETVGDSIVHNRDDITALKHTDSEPGDNILHKKAPLNEEIDESLSKLESVITKTIENTKHIEDIPEIVVEQPEDALLKEVLQQQQQQTSQTSDDISLKPDHVNRVYDNTNGENDFNVAEVLDSLSPQTSTAAGVKLEENVDVAGLATTSLPSTHHHKTTHNNNKDNHIIENENSPPNTPVLNHDNHHHHHGGENEENKQQNHHHHHMSSSSTSTDLTSTTTLLPPPPPVILIDSTTLSITPPPPAPQPPSSNDILSITSSSSSSSSSSSTIIAANTTVYQSSTTTTTTTTTNNTSAKSNKTNKMFKVDVNKYDDDDVDDDEDDEDDAADGDLTKEDEEFVKRLTFMENMRGVVNTNMPPLPPPRHHSHGSSLDFEVSASTTHHNVATTTTTPSSFNGDMEDLNNFLPTSSSSSPAAASAADGSASASSNEMAMATTLPPYLILTTPPSISPTTTTINTQDPDEVVPIENIDTGKKGVYYDTTLEPVENQDAHSSKIPSSTTPMEESIYFASSSINPPTSTPQLVVSSPASTTQEIPVSTSAVPDYIEPKMENTPPMIKSRLQKFAVTSGKSFKFSIPEDTFYDAEDMTNLRLELTDKEGRELKSNSWLQFNAETKEVYGLPLDDSVSKWLYRLTATDSGNDSVVETLEISVQQHRGVRTVNHEVNIAVKINEKNMHYIDWQMKLIKAIATTLGDDNTNSIVVREIRANPQDPSIATLVYFNETLPTSECPETELNNLVKRLDANRLSDLVYPTLGIKSITGQLIGPCQKTVAKPKTPAISVKNIPPVSRNQVDRVVATGGHLLVYKVPSDTFFDDGKLTLSLKTKDNKELSPRHWLQFDSKNEEFYGVPKNGDIGSEEYILEAEDAGGLKTTDALVVQVNPAPKRDYTVYYKAYLAIKHENFNADLHRKFVERIAQLFGDASTQNIQIRAVNTIHDSDSTLVTFYNTTLYKLHNRCPEEEMDAVRNVYLQDGTMRDRVRKTLGPELNISNLQVHTLTCNAYTDVTHRDYVPNKPEEPLLKSTFSDDYLYTIILPAIIIVTMIIVASIIACCLHRRRRKSGKMELGDEEERKSFRPKGIPVIFQDELDEKPEIGNKSPIILKNEKPPLLPPSYNTSNMNGDNDCDEYVPPPAVVVGGREARGKSPATPSYRKPPPYVSP